MNIIKKMNLTYFYNYLIISIFYEKCAWMLRSLVEDEKRESRFAHSFVGYFLHKIIAWAWNELAMRFIKPGTIWFWNRSLWSSERSYSHIDFFPHGIPLQRWLKFWKAFLVIKFFRSFQETSKSFGRTFPIAGLFFRALDEQVTYGVIRNIEKHSFSQDQVTMFK